MIELTLKEISSSIKTGKTPPSKEFKYYNGEINWYTPGDLTEIKVLNKSSRTISPLALEQKKAILHKQGTLLVGCIGDIGKLGICVEDCSSNQQLTGIYPIDEVDVNYLYYWFRGNKRKVESYANTAVVPILNNRSLGTIKLPIPPLEEQKKIAAILDAADDYRQKTKALIDKYDQLTQSVFLDMFGDPVTNPKGWKKESLGNHISLINGRAYKKSELLNEGTPVLRIQNLNGGSNWYYSDLELKADKYCYNGDLLFAWSASFGPYLFQGNKSIFHYHIWNCKMIGDLNLKFSYYLLQHLTDQIKSASHGASMLHMTKSGMEKWEIIIPAESVQSTFLNRVAQIEKQKRQAEASLVKAEELFNSLLQRAFKGELTN